MTKKLTPPSSAPRIIADSTNQTKEESREVHQQSFFLSQENEWFLTLVLLWAIQTKNAFPHGYSSPDFVAHSQRWLSYFRHNSCNDIKYVVKNTFTQPLETQASCHHYHSVWKSEEKVSFWGNYFFLYFTFQNHFSILINFRSNKYYS